MATPKRKRKRMAKATLDAPKRKRGRPTGGGGVPRIHIVKQWRAEIDEQGKSVADKINTYLGNRAEGDPKVVDVYPINIGSALVREEHAIVVIERDERRADPSGGEQKKWKQSHIDRRRNGGPERKEPIDK